MHKRRPDHFVIKVTCRSLGGVPSDLRSKVWQELLGVARSERLYLDQSILQVEEDLVNQRVITADAGRTRGNEPRFQQPETVELVVKLLTYYCKCRSIQYKQGMNEVLAPFLLLTEQREGCQDHVPLAEGVVFQCFYALIDRFLPHVFMDKEFRSLQCSFQLYRLLMLYHDPELCHYLDQHDMTPELYVTPWFMTLFARSLPPEFVFYLWDMFLLDEGPYLLHFVAYALVAANRKQIFEAEIAMLPQVLSSLTFSSRQELEHVCATALAISESTPRSFKRDLYSVCYGGFADTMVPFLDQLYACSSLQVYPEELVRNLQDRLATKSKERMSMLPSAALTEKEKPSDVKDALNPLKSPDSDRPPLLYHSGNEDENESTALKFIVLDCRPAEEYHKSHLSLSHHIYPSITKRPDALDGLIKDLSQMKGCHFCFVGPSIDSPSILSRSSSNNAAMSTTVAISNDKSQHLSIQDPSQRPIEVAVAGKVAGGTPPFSSPTGTVAFSHKQSPGEPGALASKINRNGDSELHVHAEDVSVTRLVLMFLEKGFKYVSRLDGGFDELEKYIRSMDAFAQEQLLVSSPPPLPTYEQSMADSAETEKLNLLATMGLNGSRECEDDVVLETNTSTRAETCDANSGRYGASKSMDTLDLSVPRSSFAKELKGMKKKEAKVNTTTNSTVSTFSQRLLLLKAAAKDAVSSSSSSTDGNNIRVATKSNSSVVGAGGDGWVEVRVKKGEVAGTTTDVKIQPGPIGISFRKSRTSKKYQAAVDSLVPDSQASATMLINAGDLLVAINGDSLKNKAFLSVIKLIIEAPRPVVLRFLTPTCTDKEAVTIQPLAPRLVSATRHSLCIAWEKLPVSMASSAVVLHELEFAKQCDGDGINTWLPVVMKQEGTAEVYTTGVTDKTNGTMVGLEPGESMVFRVRCKGGQRWGPYSLSSKSMRTLDVLTADASKPAPGAVTPTLGSQKELTAAVFLPGVCPKYVERGRFFYRVLQASQARSRPDLNANKLDIILERGQVIRGSERLVCPGTNQIFVRLIYGNSGDTGDQDKEIEGVQGELMVLGNGQSKADGDSDGVWASENTAQGDVILERLPESTIAEIGPSLGEQAKSVVQSFLSSHGISQRSNGSRGDHVNSNSSSSIGSLISNAASRSSTSSVFSSIHAPAPPHILRTSPASSSEIIVTWNPVNDIHVAKYQIQYARGRFAAIWWTVKPDIAPETCSYSVTGLHSNTSYRFRIRSGTKDKKWSPFSDSSESCRTLPTSSDSVFSGAAIHRQSASSGRNKRSATTSSILARQSAPPMRTRSTVVEKTATVASRPSVRSQTSSSLQIEMQTNVAHKGDDDDDDDDETQLFVDDRKSELKMPESRYVNLANWKSSSRVAHKDFRFYHVTKLEELNDDSCQTISLGHRELVVTPSLLIVLNVMVATREGFAFVEEWRPLTSLTKVAERDGLDNGLVFHFKDRAVTTPGSIDNAQSSNRLLVVVEGAQACAKVVKDYYAKTQE
ncbi:unnamed protein product [Peronospora farinosa]|uniref:TBC1 domain family member 23 n=1 Tax=Peronospora farinosa TaxID=134698 RepID=A0AAV0SV38_9STRA|nr:unnamed protein product [Peronospora farinosa]CAI5708980.1 unnamed protein product [Peronospora farinosa]